MRQQCQQELSAAQTQYTHAIRMTRDMTVLSSRAFVCSFGKRILVLCFPQIDVKVFGINAVQFTPRVCYSHDYEQEQLQTFPNS